MPKIVYPTLTGWVAAGAGDHPTFLNVADAWDADDPFVKEYPQWFAAEPSERLHTSVPVVEQATAAPGEQRAVAAPVDDLDALRAEAEAAGVKVDKRWGADRLHEEIDAASE